MCGGVKERDDQGVMKLHYDHIQTDYHRVRHDETYIIAWNQEES